MTSKELLEKMQKNSKADLIPKGAEFEVYNADNKKLGIIAVQRTTIVYLDMKEIPQDLLIGNYIFKEITE